MRPDIDDDVARREAFGQPVFVASDHVVENRLIQRAVAKLPGHDAPRATRTLTPTSQGGQSQRSRECAPGGVPTATENGGHGATAPLPTRCPDALWRCPGVA